MATLRDAAENYEAPSTLNIADLDIIPIDCPIEEKVFKEGTEDEFKINVAKYKGEDYRVPNSVLDTIKTLLKEMPEINYVKVIKEGTGMNTKYKVVPKSAPAPGQGSPREVSSQIV